MTEAIMTSSKLVLTYEVGIDEKGNPIYKTKSYPHVKELATPDGLYQTAQALASLSTDVLSSIKRNDVSKLI